jgi:hypothetical protein
MITNIRILYKNGKFARNVKLETLINNKDYGSIINIGTSLIKNNIELYQGDIIKADNDYYLIEYHNYSFVGIRLEKDKNQFIYRKSKDINIPLSAFEDMDYTIITNIHQHLSI